VAAGLELEGGRQHGRVVAAGIGVLAGRGRVARAAGVLGAREGAARELADRRLHRVRGQTADLAVVVDDREAELVAAGAGRAAAEAGVDERVVRRAWTVRGGADPAGAQVAGGAVDALGGERAVFMARGLGLGDLGRERRVAVDAPVARQVAELAPEDGVGPGGGVAAGAPLGVLGRMAAAAGRRRQQRG